MKNTLNRAAAAPDRTHELKAELALKVARHIGSSEKLATAIPRLTLHRRTGPTAGCPVTYEPSVIVIPQGRKQVQIGGETLTYDLSNCLLTSVDLPTIASVVEASEKEPCLAVNLKLDISIVREFLSQEEFHSFDVPPDSLAMSTGHVTAEFLGAWCRLLDLLSTPWGHSVPERTRRTRDHVPNPTWTGRRTITGNRDLRRSEIKTWSARRRLRPSCEHDRSRNTEPALLRWPAERTGPQIQACRPRRNWTAVPRRPDSPSCSCRSLWQ